MAKDRGSSVKNDKQYEGLRRKGMSNSRAAAISNSEGSSSRGRQEQWFEQEQKEQRGWLWRQQGTEGGGRSQGW
jgi:hypothetical protein